VPWSAAGVADFDPDALTVRVFAEPFSQELLRLIVETRACEEAHKTKLARASQEQPA
jgi:hypothetical protein